MPLNHLNQRASISLLKYEINRFLFTEFNKNIH